MPTPPLSDATIRKTVAAYIKADGPSKSLYVLAREIKISAQTLKEHLALAEARGIPVPQRTYKERHVGMALSQPAIPFEVAALPDDDLDAEEVAKQHKAAFRKKRQHEQARRLIPVKVGVPGPIGILHFGDPHVDDPGTDLDLLDRHSDLTRAYDYIIGANVGDTTNNWVGRLAALYQAQNAGRKRAIKLAGRFINRTKWLYIIGGNHDVWSGDDDPMIWISKLAGSTYQASECRIELRFPEGDPVRVNARHDFAGHSQWNPAHGPMKAAMMGVRDHLLVCGHRHESAHGVIKDPQTGITCHALKVASYKIYDRYARDKGLRDQALGPAAFTIIDPALPDDHPDRIVVTWDPEVGVEILKAMRAARKLPWRAAK